MASRRVSAIPDNIDILIVDPRQRRLLSFYNRRRRQSRRLSRRFDPDNTLVIDLDKQVDDDILVIVDVS